MGGIRVTFRLDDELADVLRELSNRANLNLSSTMRELVRQAGARNELWPPPMLTERELTALLAERARGGSVTATVTLLKRLDRHPPEPEEDPFAFLDEHSETAIEGLTRRRNGHEQDDPDV